MFRIWIVLFILCLMLLSCSEDSNPSEPAPEHFAITIHLLPDTIKGIVGTTQEVSFYVDLKRDDGTVVKGQTVKFTDATGIGLVTPDELVTNETGEATAKYSVEMPADETASRIIAEANNRTTSASVTLIPIDRPWSMSVHVDYPVLFIEDNNPEETEINVTVINSDGLAVPGIHIGFSLDPERNPEIIGSVIASAITDSSGRAKSTFRTFNSTGVAVVTARVEEPGFEENIQSWTGVEVRRKSISTLTIDLDRALLRISQVASRDTVYTVGITAVVMDSDGQIVQDAPPIQYSTSHGRIVDGALHFNPAIDMENNESITILVQAIIHLYHLSANREIQVHVNNDLPILTLSSDRYAIQADGSGGSHANLSLALATASGLPIPGKEVIIRGSGNCIIQSPVLTDSMGIATAVFDDMGESGLVSVFAESEYGNSDSIEISIQENWVEVTHIDLFVENTTYDPLNIDSTKVRAVCYLENGFPVPGGNGVYFEAEHGQISSRHVLIDARNGSAETYYKPRHGGLDLISAYVMNLHNFAYSDTIAVNVLSGLPNRLRLQAFPNE
ncbi:MAG: hypothetical protein HN590_18395, partial [Calditrichaeota bacterium]|nr:hypothetical protein [Calditrichota bacterium]